MFERCVASYSHVISYFTSPGGVIKDQATADEDASLQERLAIGVGSVAGGLKDSSDDALVHNIAKTVEKGAGKVADHYAETRDKSSSSSSDD